MPSILVLVENKQEFCFLCGMDEQFDTFDPEFILEEVQESNQYFL